jgi:hypothetical protein
VLYTFQKKEIGLAQPRKYEGMVAAPAGTGWRDIMPIDHASLRDRAARTAELSQRDLERLELEVRRAASRQRLLLQRGPETDRGPPGAGRYRLVSARNGEVVAGAGYGLTLGDAIELLHNPEPA